MPLIVRFGHVALEAKKVGSTEADSAAIRIARGTVPFGKPKLEGKLHLRRRLRMSWPCR